MPAKEIHSILTEVIHNNEYRYSLRSEYFMYDSQKFLADFKDLKNRSYFRINFLRNYLGMKGPKNALVSKPTEPKNKM